MVANGPGTLGTGSVTMNTGATLRVVTNPNPVPTVTGFNNGTGWTVTSANAATAAPFSLDPNTLLLTSNLGNEARSAFLNAPVPISGGFTAKYTYQATGRPEIWPTAWRSSCRTTRVVPPPSGAVVAAWATGTARQSHRAPRSKPNVYAPNTPGIALGQNGSIGPFTSAGSVNPASQDPINIVVQYDPTSLTLTETLTDTTTNQTFVRVDALPSDLPTIVGGATAFLGFTGADGGAASTQTVNNFSFAPGTDTNYVNAVNLTGGASATIDVSTLGPPNVNMGPLTVGAGVGTTLNFSATTVPSGTSYGVGFSSATFNGNVAINIPFTGFTATATMSVNGPSTFASNVAVTVNSGRLKFANGGIASTIGSGTSVNIASGASVELAGTTSNLSDSGAASHRVHIVNDSSQTSPPNGSVGGLVVTGTNQQVGAIDGIGDTTVNDGASLTANHIVQNALVIGSAGASPSLVTIAPSDASGNPLAVAGSVDSGSSSNSLAPGGSSDASLGAAPAGAVGSGSAAVPEPSSLLLVLVGGLAGLATMVRRRKRA